jgi:hypothetical protein
MNKTKILKENDLMVGNIVNFNPNLFIDNEYEPPKPIEQITIKDGEYIEWASGDCFSPIPCTPEFFEKNGFERKEVPDSEYGEEMFFFEEWTDNGYCSITITWRDSFDNCVYGENHEQWDERWTINATCGTRTYNSDNEDVIYVHELQQICHILGINKNFIV